MLCLLLIVLSATFFVLSSARPSSEDSNVAVKDLAISVNGLHLGDRLQDFRSYNLPNLGRGRYLIVCKEHSFRVHDAKVVAVCGVKLGVNDSVFREGDLAISLCRKLGEPEVKPMPISWWKVLLPQPRKVHVYNSVRLEAGVKENDLLSGGFYLGDWDNSEKDVVVYH